MDGNPNSAEQKEKGRLKELNPRFQTIPSTFYGSPSQRIK